MYGVDVCEWRESVGKGTEGGGREGGGHAKVFGALREESPK